MSQSDLWHQRTGVFKLNLHKEKGENLIELVFEKELFRNVKTQCYDILHLSSQTPHRRRRNTEWLTCLIINSLIDTHALLSRFFFFFFSPFVSDEGFKARRGTVVRPLPQLDPLVFFLYKGTLQVHIRQQQPAAVQLRPNPSVYQ